MDFNKAGSSIIDIGSSLTQTTYTMIILHLALALLKAKAERNITPVQPISYSVSTTCNSGTFEDFPSGIPALCASLQKELLGNSFANSIPCPFRITTYTEQIVNRERVMFSE